jgi:hypothetical protein
MKGFIDDNQVDNTDTPNDWEQLNDDGEWVAVDPSDMLEGPPSAALRQKFNVRAKPPKIGKATKGQPVRKALSKTNQLFLEHFVAPLAVGLTIDAITGEKVLKHPEGSAKSSDGTVKYPDGSIAKPDNTIAHPDGSVSTPDYITTYKDGSSFNRRTGLMTFTDGAQVQGVKDAAGNWEFPE